MIRFGCARPDWLAVAVSRWGGSKDAGMTQPAKSQEPSMEEILASIRRIIADDDATKPSARPIDAAQAPAPAPRPAAPPPRMQPPPVRPAAPPPRTPEPLPELAPAGDDGAGSDILDLTESMAAAPPPEPAPAPAPGFRTINAQSDVIFDDEPAPPPPAPIRAFVEEPVHHPVAERHEQRDLLSTSASAAVDSAFGALASTVLTHSSHTIEDLVREILRPMLKTWLDDNLPGMVERLVRAEIERVSRGRNTA
jgi:hypothetical protein